MRITILLLFLPMVANFALPTSRAAMEKEYQMRFGKAKKKKWFGLFGSSQEKPKEYYFKKMKAGNNDGFYKPGMIIGGDTLPPKPTPPNGRDTTLADLAGKYKLESEQNGNKKVIFTHPVKVRKSGFLFKWSTSKSQAYFFSDDTLSASYSRLDTSTPVKVGRYNLEASTWFSFGKNGRIKFLCPASSEVKTLQIGNYSIKYHPVGPDGYLQKIFFYDNGNVSSIHIKEPHTLRVGSRSYQFIYSKGCGGSLDFYEDGKLKSGYIGKTEKINGITLKKGSLVKFYKSGRLKETAFSGTKMIQGYLVASADRYWPNVEFYENGRLKKIDALGKTRTINGKTYRKGHVLHFKENGEIDY